MITSRCCTMPPPSIALPLLPKMHPSLKGSSAYNTPARGQSLPQTTKIESETPNVLKLGMILVARGGATSRDGEATGPPGGPVGESKAYMIRLGERHAHAHTRKLHNRTQVQPLY